jgi:hypothetical protein
MTAPSKKISGITRLKKKNARLRIARRMRTFVSVHVLFSASNPM